MTHAESRILIANIGSTSLKYQILGMPTENCLARGRFERIGQDDGIWSHEGHSRTLPLPNYGAAIDRMVEVLDQPDGPTKGLEGLDAVGFKAVIAKGIDGCVELDEEVLRRTAEYRLLAPAHNPPYIEAISAFRERLPSTKLIGLFEPAFHTQAPDYARTYAIPERWREVHAVRRYGYHGASHRYVAERMPALLERDPQDLRLISCHLGGSSSICAVRGGVSIDTSMGFSPQSGLFHATRHGELDPFAVLYVMREDGLTEDEVVEELTKKSGLAGLSGISSGDMREIEEAMDRGEEKARLAFDAFCYEVKKQIGAYVAALGGLDGLAFAGGIGERGWRVREAVCRELEVLGIALDVEANRSADGVEKDITGSSARVQSWVVPTNEELIVARACHEFLQMESTE